jgi:hypothetical protein
MFMARSYRAIQLGLRQLCKLSGVTGGVNAG